jgi:hypothetical protein
LTSLSRNRSMTRTAFSESAVRSTCMQ